MTTIIWFRQDLRLADHPLVQWALGRGDDILPVFVWDESADWDWPPGGASRWWLHHSLRSLSQALESKGSRLILRRGSAAEVIPELVRSTGAEAVGWSRRYEPAVVARDKKLRSKLSDMGCQVFEAEANLLIEPDQVATKTGGPYQVYTPFWNTLKPRIAPRHLAPAPKAIPYPQVSPATGRLEDWGLLPTNPDWSGGLRKHWQPGEAGALARLESFLPHMGNYGQQRDLPSVEGTSSLSPHLHWGEISPSRIWDEVLQRAALSSPGVETYCKELVWREFAYHLLHHFPHIPAEPLRKDFTTFPWKPDTDSLRRWQKGTTGIPIVDAGMRQLWHTGWMHNRVRMIVGSYLVKNLLQPWQDGAAWFWDTLVDADLASNTMGWQWVAGCGADAAPYFRIFNPVSQSQKFDPTCGYIRRFVPELARLPDKVIHAPWEHPRLLLEDHGVKLGINYPEPQVDLKETRTRALAAYDAMRGKS